MSFVSVTNHGGERVTTGRFVYVTALHSAMMVFPWIYLFAYWIGKPMPLRLAQFGYAAMCLRWFFSPAWVGLYVGARAPRHVSGLGLGVRNWVHCFYGHSSWVELVGVVSTH